MFDAGQRVAQFTIVRKLGEGGMGAVYLAEDEKLRRQVALKVLPVDFSDDPERRERFQREARTAASISHPNVMAIYDIGEAVDPVSNRPFTYIVMEYIDGRQLNEVLDQDALDLKQKLRLAERIASGLSAAHKLKIVHRDIKAENILVDGEGNPKILDFGLAKMVDAPFQSDQDSDTAVTVEANLTQVGRVVGTVATMSPEQAQGQELDHRSDIFSFGVLLYRIVSGRAPFTGETQVAVLAKILESSPQPLTQLDGELPDAVSAIVDRCLEKDPGRRYATTADLVEALRAARHEWDSGISRTAGSGIGISVAAPAGKSRRNLMAGLAAVALVALAVIVISVLRGGGGGPSPVIAGEPHLAILRFENKTQDAELEWLTTGLPEILLTDLAPLTDLSLISLERVEDSMKRDGKNPDEATSRSLGEAGRKLGATTVLYGSYFRIGDKIRIDARLEDAATGEILFADKVVGEDAFVLVENLTQVIAAKLDVQTPLDDQPRGAQFTTASAEAYKYYHLGDDKFFAGLHDEARELYTQALAVDSTFALPYMRIGMSHVFEGRTDQGVTYLRKAGQYQDKLPPRDKALLDIYSDIWIKTQFDDVTAKLDGFVNTYPDDKEALTFHGALVIGLSADTTRGFAQFEKVLELDPTNPFAMAMYADDLEKFKQYDRAIAMHKRHVAAHPESPGSYEDIGDLYVKKGQLDQALEAYEDYRRRFPNNPEVLNNMASLAIRTRKFDRARAYIEEIPALKPGDPQWGRIVESSLGNLDVWDGRFNSALDRARSLVNHSLEMGDTSAINVAYQALGGTYRSYDMIDSSLVAFELANRYSPRFSRMQYPVIVVEAHPERAAEMRPRLEEACNWFREVVPSSMWSITDVVKAGFEAHAAQDTTQLIAVSRRVLEFPPNQRAGNEERQLGELLTQVGEFEEALPLLETGLDTTNGWLYITAMYWIGVCKEGLGDTEGAVKAYKEVLSYWANADREVKPLKDTRVRLARLSG